MPYVDIPQTANQFILKPDKRFRRNHISKVGNVFRGHPDALDMKIYEIPVSKDGLMNIDAMKYALVSPVVVSDAKGER